MRIDEFDSTPIANLMVKEIQYRLANMGFIDFTVESDTLDFWIKIIVKTGGDPSWSMDVDWTELEKCGGLEAVISDLSLKIARWLGGIQDELRQSPPG